MEITAPSKGTRGSCAACGDTPVAHFPTYVSQSFEAWFADRMGRIEEKLEGPAARFRHGVDRFIDHIPKMARLMRIAGISRDPERACSYRSQVVWEEAARRGIEMQQLTWFGLATEFYRARLNGRWIYFQSLPVPPHLWKNMYPGIDDKARLKRHLSEHGIPVSTAVSVSTFAEAQRAFDSMTKPIVVKPRMGSRARHTTTNIRTLDDLRAAYDSARQLCRYVLLEEHLEGAVSRATCVEGKLVGYLQMFQAAVVGDGTHTIAELVALKNASRNERVGEVRVEPEHLSYLARSGYTLDSVPARGALVELSRRTGRFEGGKTREMKEAVHPALRAHIERAARLLRAPVVGFDVIIPDPEGDPAGQRWGILEANSLPYIDLHYAPLEGEPSNVAAAVWDLWETPRGA